MKRVLCIVTLLLVTACAADDVEVDLALTAGAPAALPLTKRQAAEVLIRAGCTRTAFCNHRDAHLVGHHVPGETGFVDSCVDTNVRAYCHEDPGYCASVGFPGAELCMPRDCAAATTTSLEAATACSNAVNNDANTCSEYQSPGCFYAILGLSVPYP